MTAATGYQGSSLVCSECEWQISYRHRPGCSQEGKTAAEMSDAATTPRDWGRVNVRFLWKHRHVHPMIRERLRWWIDYARTA